MIRQNEWKLIPIEEVYLGLYDGPHATPKPASEGPIFLGIKNITEDGKLDLSEIRHIAEEDFSNWTKRVQPLPGDIVFTYEATLNRYAMIPEGFRGCLGRRLALIRPNFKRINTKFLFYYFFGEEWRNTIANNIMSGSTVDRIPIISFPKFKVRVPPLPIQHTIASILSAYDDLIENNTRRIAILEEMAQMIYEEWFVKFRFPGCEEVKMLESEMGRIPEGWKKVNLEDVCSITMGQSPSSQFYNEQGNGLPFHQGVSDFGSRFPTDRVYCTVENRVALSRDILFSVRAPVGRLNMANKKIVIGRGLCAIRSKTESQRFIFQQLKDQFQEEDSIGNGSIFKAVTKEDVYNIKLTWPSQSLVSSFEEFIQPVFSLVEALIVKNANLHRTRDLLLPKLISGEIDVSSWSEDNAEEAIEELAASAIGPTSEYNQRAGRVRKVAEAGPIEPMEKDALEWHSLWEG